MALGGQSNRDLPVVPQDPQAQKVLGHHVALVDPADQLDPTRLVGLVVQKVLARPVALGGQVRRDRPADLVARKESWQCRPCQAGRSQDPPAPPGPELVESLN